MDDETEDENVGLTKGRYSSSSSSASSAKAASKAKAPSAVVALTAPSADLGSFSQKPAPLEGVLEHLPVAHPLFDNNIVFQVGWRKSLPVRCPAIAGKDGSWLDTSACPVIYSFYLSVIVAWTKLLTS